MKTLYHVIYSQLSTFKQQKITNKSIIRTYWLTNMACTIVYIDNHYHIGNKKQLAYLVKHYNSIMQSKVVDLENTMAYDNKITESNATSNSFVNSAPFDIITINTIRNVFQTYEELSNHKVKLINIPHIRFGGLST